jgi:hypothetical protein
MKNGELLAKNCCAHQTLDGNLNYSTTCLFTRKNKYIVMYDQGETGILFYPELQYFKNKEKAYEVFTKYVISTHKELLKQHPETINRIRSFDEENKVTTVIGEISEDFDNDFNHVLFYDDELKKIVSDAGFEMLKELKEEMEGERNGQKRSCKNNKTSS